MNTSKYQFYLDGILYSDPVGWPSWVASIKRDQDIGGITSTTDGNFTFTGDAYTYLYNQRKQGYCAIIDVLIMESCGRNGSFEVAYKGFIFLSDVEFNITKCTASCTLEDDSYFSRIDNNKSIECYVNAGKSKNGVDIDIPSEWTVSMFDPCTGTATGLPDPVTYRLHDVVRYLIDFLTDATVGFRSTVLDIGGEFEGMMLTNGLLIRDPASTDKSIIFRYDSVMRNIRNLCNLSFTIENIGTGPVFVLEKTEDTYGSATLFTFDNVYEVIRKIDQSRNIAAVELGSEDIIESTGCGSGTGDPAFPDQINLVGCKSEQFAVTGVCNIDSVKDLTTDWVISSNVVEQIHILGADSWDGNIVLIHCENLDSINFTADAIQGDVFGTTLPVYYNSNFYNAKVVERHFSGIPSSLVKYLSAPVVGFKAISAPGVTFTNPGYSTGAYWEHPQWAFPIDYGTDGYDLSNDWGNGTTQGNFITNQTDSLFTSPFDNMYRFKFNFSFIATPPGTILLGPTMIATFEKWDPTNLILLASYVTTQFFPANQSLSGLSLQSPLIFLGSGEIMRLRVQFTYSWPLEDYSTSIELMTTGTQGGEFQVFNTEDYIADNYHFSVPLSLYQFNQIKNSPISKISFNDGKNTDTGWIDFVKYNKEKGIAEFKLVTTTG